MKNNTKGFETCEVAIVLTIIGLLIAMALPCCVKIGVPGGALKDYSEGSRSGQITKLSNKGLIWKSWEAEMNMGGTSPGENGAVATVFAFNVEAALVPKIQDALTTGKRVEVVYHQWGAKPLSIGSDYVAIDVRATK